MSEYDGWKVHALLGFHADTWRLYMAGFRTGASILSEAVLKGREDAEFLVYPIVFLYRHCIELQLKRILRQGQALHGQTPSVDTRHSLVALWQGARLVVEEHFPNTPTDSPSNLNPFIEELDGLDPKSFSFRYPDGWKGTSTSVNVEEIHNKLERVVEALDNYQAYFQAKIEEDSEFLALFDQDAEHDDLPRSDSLER